MVRSAEEQTQGLSVSRAEPRHVPRLPLFGGCSHTSGSQPQNTSRPQSTPGPPAHGTAPRASPAPQSAAQLLQQELPCDSGEIPPQKDAAPGSRSGFPRPRVPEIRAKQVQPGQAAQGGGAGPLGAASRSFTSRTTPAAARPRPAAEPSAALSKPSSGEHSRFSLPTPQSTEADGTSEPVLPAEPCQAGTTAVFLHRGSAGAGETDLCSSPVRGRRGDSGRWERPDAAGKPGTGGAPCSCPPPLAAPCPRRGHGARPCPNPLTNTRVGSSGGRGGRETPAR